MGQFSVVCNVDLKDVTSVLMYAVPDMRTLTTTKKHFTGYFRLLDNFSNPSHVLENYHLICMQLE